MTRRPLAAVRFPHTNLLWIRVAMIAMMLATLALPRTSWGACPDFATAVNYSAGTNPTSVAVGDFNGDGKPDLAVVNISDGNVSILLDNGNGTFATAVNYGVGSSPGFVAVGDFNGDGKPDLAVANELSGNVSILVGNGDGTFAAAVNYGAGTNPYSVAVGDFNGDGKPDLAVANGGSNNVSVLLGNGSGTFAGAVNYGAGTEPDSVGIGDFNGDGKPDLAVANFSSSTSSAVSILLGNGDGTFAAAVNYGAGSGPSSVAIGDFNGDGKPDLAVANYSSNSISILFNSCPADLTVTKFHLVSFTQGDKGQNYTIIVNNFGAGPTGGTVTMTDTLPAGLTATAISGTGWTCNLGTLTCTRSDAIAAPASYPAITVTVNVNSNAASSMTNTATVSGGGEIDTANDSASDLTTVNPSSGIIAPTNLVATATSTTQVSVSWDAVTNAASYQVFRRSNNGPYSLVGSPMTTNFPDSGLLANTTYLYQVKAVDASNHIGPPSNIDLATTIVFTDDAVVAGSTVIKAVHLTELRTAVNAVRATAGLTPATFTDTITAGVFVKAIHVTELRSNLDVARGFLSLPAIQYTDPTLTGGSTLVKAAHIQELRSGVK